MAAVVEAERYTLVSTQCSHVTNCAVLPKNRIYLGVAGQRVDCAVCCSPDDQAALIDPLVAATSATGERTQVAEDAVLPLERVHNVRIQPVGVVGLVEIGALWVIRIKGRRICGASGHSPVV